MAEDRRRYPRVFLDKSLGDFIEIMGVKVHWPNGDVGGALDVSYIGAALTKPAGLPIRFTQGEELPLYFQFSENKVFLKSYFVREIPQAIGVYFSNLSPQANLAIEKFLKHKLIGTNTRLIPKNFYSREQTFSHWYHGPNDTNIFIWYENGKIEKATVELATQVLFIEDDKIFFTKVESWFESDDYAYYIKNKGGKNILQNNSPFFENVVSVLTQVPSLGGPINQLLNHLKSLHP